MNTMKPITETRELMSALADGQLGGDDFADALKACEQDSAALDSWKAYHLIGDVLRSPALALPGDDAAFLARLNNRLGQEAAASLRPQTMSPAPQDTQQPASVPLKASQESRAAASNDGNFRWKLVAGFASLAAVSALAWNAVGLLLAPAAAPQLAQAPASPSPQILVASPQGTMVRDARLEELLAAHKQFGSASALQLPSGFLRNATFETPRGTGR